MEACGFLVYNHYIALYHINIKYKRDPAHCCRAAGGVREKEGGYCEKLCSDFQFVSDPCAVRWTPVRLQLVPEKCPRRCRDGHGECPADPDPGSNPGSRDDTYPDNSGNTDPCPDACSNPGSHTGTDAGSDTHAHSDPGSNPCADPGSHTCTGAARFQSSGRHQESYR